MGHVAVMKFVTYASYALTSDVTDLWLIGYYTQCHCYFTEHSLSNLDLACMILHVTSICMLHVAPMPYVMCCSHAHQ